MLKLSSTRFVRDNRKEVENGGFRNSYAGTGSAQQGTNEKDLHK